MKTFLYLAFTIVTCILHIPEGFTQKISYNPKTVANAKKVIEDLIYTDYKQGRKVSEVNITEYRLSIAFSLANFDYPSGIYTGKKVVYKTIDIQGITKLQIIHQKSLSRYIVEIYDSRKRSKQYIIFTRSLEDAQKCCDALYTLQLGRQE